MSVEQILHERGIDASVELEAPAASDRPRSYSGHVRVAGMAGGPDGNHAVIARMLPIEGTTDCMSASDRRGFVALPVLVVLAPPRNEKERLWAAYRSAALSMERQQLGAAEEQARAVVTLDPAAAVSQALLGRVLRACGKMREARLAYLTAIDLVTTGRDTARGIALMDGQDAWANQVESWRRELASIPILAE
jgi:hypothetical protein